MNCIVEIPVLSNLKGPQFSEKYFIFHYPEFRDYLLNNYPTDISFQEKIYWYFNNIHTYPLCPICGKRLKLINVREGYQKTCSKKCSNSNPCKIQKSKDTCIEKYGGVAPACSLQIRKQIEITTTEKYGVKNAMQNDNIKSKQKRTCLSKYGGQGNSSNIIFDKYKKTCLERYGVENSSQSRECINKMKQTNLERYGVECVMNTPENLIKQKEGKRKKVHSHYPEIIDFNNHNWICDCPHSNCNKCKERWYETPASIYRDRLRDGTELCTRLLPVGADNTKGTTIELFIRDILDKYNIEYTINDRSIISPKELDIYIPSKNIAFECNGVYSHSTNYINPKKESSYHINKYILCKEKNIQLISLWEDWIKNKPSIIESVVKSKLGIYDYRYGARQFKVSLCDKSVARQFLKANHIQGSTTFDIAYGLYKNDELYAVMTFGKKKALSGNNQVECNEWALNRFCTKLNTQIVGGAEKLLKAFIRNYNPKIITSFACNDISNGNLYKKLGFITDSKINNSYWYIKAGSLERYHRSTFTKSSIVRRGWKDKIDNSWTEIEIMNQHKYLRIYDSGTTKYILHL